MKNFKLKLIIATPIICYLISFLYIALSHNTLNVFNKVVHENGKNTFLETCFYASHFIGHIPTITILALYFAGCLISFSGKIEHKANFIPLLVFALLSFKLSLFYFGQDDTFSYLLQNRQQANDYTQGGAWNLHIPSTIAMFFFIPSFLFLIFNFLEREIRFNSEGYKLIISAFSFFIILCLIINNFDFSNIIYTLVSARYQAHSVREIATFPITYFPLVIYFYFKNKSLNEIKNKLNPLAFSTAFIFLVILTYQIYISLSSGIDNLSQNPAFTNKKLDIPYLLSTHYFEHFLDTVYFFLLAKYLISKSD